jgi:uncharacterized protein DUF6985
VGSCFTEDGFVLVEASESSRLVRIVFAPEGRGNEPLTHAELSSVSWLVENESSIAESLLNSLLEKYPSLRRQYGYSKEDEANLMPVVTTVNDFRSMIGLHSVNVHPISRDGVPYVGFEFGCSWDDEHGLGVLMHGTRTVEIGGADTAILLWIAKRDAQRRQKRFKPRRGSYHCV